MTADDLRNIFGPDREMRRIAFGAPLSAQFAEFVGKFFDLLGNGVRPLEFLPLARLIVIDIQSVDLVFFFAELRGSVIGIEARTRSRFVDQIDRFIGQIAVGNVAVG